ncbi:MAG: heat-inducible transcriptional repressor HrcA [Eggerthellaceae bacterium]|nr:heat-inducible transcriptional repressor HrcA [Eggerthellaceae bacterium]
MLSDRRQRVLSALIEEYVAYALPVGSRTLVERYQLGVSPATVRNELSVLEDGGYITQPHTSAGRIPTDAGYRAFVDDLLESGPVEAGDAAMVEELRNSATELDSLFEKTSKALSRLTDCLSIVLTPSVISQQLKQLSLVSLNDYQALIVVVTEDGQVLNRHMDFTEPVEAEKLASLQGLFNRCFIGKSLKDMELAIDRELIDAFQDPLTHLVLDELILCLQENRSSKAHRLGVSALLQKPEFSRSQSLVPIMQILEDDTVLLHIFDEGLTSKSTVVKIGRENIAEQLSGVSVVASQYGRDEAAGIVAVIGPTRMDYSKAIQAVRAAQQVLQDI